MDVISDSRKSGIDQCVEDAGRRLNKDKSGKKSIVILTDNRDCTADMDRCKYTKEFQSVGEKAGYLKGIQLLAYILPFKSAGSASFFRSYSKKEMSKIRPCPPLFSQCYHLQWGS